MRRSDICLYLGPADRAELKALVPENPVPGEFYARGVYGQFIRIDQNRDLVIAVNSADRSFRQPGVMDTNIAMLRTIARVLEEARDTEEAP